MCTIIQRPYVHSPSHGFRPGNSRRIAIMTPITFPRTSQTSECHTAPATAGDACCVWSDRSALMNPPIAHLNEAIAGCGKTAVMCGHQKGHTLSTREIQEQVKDRGAGALVE